MIILESKQCDVFMEDTMRCKPPTLPIHPTHGLSALFHPTHLPTFMTFRVRNGIFSFEHRAMGLGNERKGY